MVVQTLLGQTDPTAPLISLLSRRVLSPPPRYIAHRNGKTGVYRLTMWPTHRRKQSPYKVLVTYFTVPIHFNHRSCVLEIVRIIFLHPFFLVFPN